MPAFLPPLITAAAFGARSLIKNPIVWSPKMPIHWKIGLGYQKFNKFMEGFGPMGYGAMYAGGTVLGYQGMSSFFRPKWRYLGSPQRLKKI